MEQDQKLTAWQVVREPSGEIREIKNKCPLSKSRCQDNCQDNQSEATGRLIHFRERRKHMDSPAHTTTGLFNRRVWIQIVSRWRKIERKKTEHFESKSSGNCVSNRTQFITLAKSEAAVLLVVFAQNSPPPLPIIALHHDVHRWVASSCKHVMAEHWSKIRLQCLHRVPRAAKTIINRTWKIRARDLSPLIKRSAGNQRTIWTLQLAPTDQTFSCRVVLVWGVKNLK